MGALGAWVKGHPEKVPIWGSQRTWILVFGGSRKNLTPECAAHLCSRKLCPVSVSPGDSTAGCCTNASHPNRFFFCVTMNFVETTEALWRTIVAMEQVFPSDYFPVYITLYLFVFVCRLPWVSSDSR